MAHRSLSSLAPSRWRILLVPLLAAVLAAAVPDPARADGYTVAEGDVLEISVFDHPDLGVTAQVGADGRIAFPLVGQLEVAGLTAPGIAAALTAALADGFIVEPRVTVSLRRMRTRRASIVGRVNRPGIYEFQGRLTLLELLSRAGGLAPDAGDKAVVKRAPSGGGLSGELVVDLRALVSEGALNRDVEIVDGDAVTVSEAGVFTLAGEVRRPGEYRHEPAMTLLRAVALAGGFTERADPARLRIVRAAGAAAAPPASGDDPLGRIVEAGDIVTVPPAGVFYLTGEVRRPGEYRIEEGMTLLRAVTLAGGFTERADRQRLRIIRVSGGREHMLDPAGSPASPDTPLEAGDIVVVNVARAEVCYVTGEVKSAGAYPCERGTTVIRAVTLAGGFTDAAARSRIRIIRRVGGREEAIERVALDDAILPDDVLVVPKSFF